MAATLCTPTYAQKPDRNAQGPPHAGKYPWGNEEPFIPGAPKAPPPQHVEPNHWYLKQAGTLPFVIVWNDSAAHSKGLGFIQHDMLKTHPELVYPLMACVVPNGAEAIMDAVGMFSDDITVISGEHAGCSGNIASNDIFLKK